MRRSTRIHISLAALIAALLVVTTNDAAVAQDRVGEGRRLADAWCSECHAVGRPRPAVPGAAPSLAAIASRPGTTALALKVFLKTSHGNMPNLVIQPDQADALADYILSLKAD